MTKNWWQSKTVWFNVLTGIVSTLGMIQGTVPESLAPYIIAAVGIVNVILRVFFTTVPLA